MMKNGGPSTVSHFEDTTELKNNFAFTLIYRGPQLRKRQFNSMYIYIFFLSQT